MSKSLKGRLSGVFKRKEPDYQGAYEQLVKTSFEVCNLMKKQLLNSETQKINADIETAVSICEKSRRSQDAVTNQHYKELYNKLREYLKPIFSHVKEHEYMQIWNMLGVSMVFSELYLETKRKNSTSLERARNRLAELVDRQINSMSGSIQPGLNKKGE